MKGKTVREATYMLLRYQGISILTSPERFLSYLMDVTDQTTREFELLRNACSEELLGPFYHALEPDSHVSLSMATLSANTYLLGMGSDTQLSMTLVQQIADGCMDYDKLQVTSGEEMSSGADESTKN